MIRNVNINRELCSVMALYSYSDVGIVGSYASAFRLLQVYALIKRVPPQVTNEIEVLY